MRLLARALDLEHETIAAYSAGIPCCAGRGSDAAKRFLDFELSHAGELSGLIHQAGVKPARPRAVYDLGHPQTPREVLELLLGLEQRQLAMYLAMVPQLSDGADACGGHRGARQRRPARGAARRDPRAGSDSGRAPIGGAVSRLSRRELIDARRGWRGPALVVPVSAGAETPVDQRVLVRRPAGDRAARDRRPSSGCCVSPHLAGEARRLSRRILAQEHRPRDRARRGRCAARRHPAAGDSGHRGRDRPAAVGPPRRTHGRGPPQRARLPRPAARPRGRSPRAATTGRWRSSPPPAAGPGRAACWPATLSTRRYWGSCACPKNFDRAAPYAFVEGAAEPPSAAAARRVRADQPEGTRAGVAAEGADDRLGPLVGELARATVARNCARASNGVGHGAARRRHRASR